MRKNIYIFIACLGVLFLSGKTTDALAGSGTKMDPYLISTCQELQNIQNLTAHYQLTRDIDCAGIVNFIPIGGANAFEGTLDGQFYTIRNLKISNKTADRIGLFSQLEAGEIKNLRLRNAHVIGNRKVGILASEAGEETIRGISVQGTVTCLEECGGLVGSLYGGGANIKDSDFKGTIMGVNRLGGLAGKVQHYASIDRSYAKGSIELNEDLMGNLIVATGQPIKSMSKDINSSLRVEPITGLDQTIELTKGGSVGGLVGELSEFSEINNSYARSTVKGNTRVGGLVGLNTTDAEIHFSFSNGFVYGKSGVGGLVGENNAKIVDSYANTTVSGTENAGGLVGTNEPNGEIQRAFAKGNVEASNSVGGLVGTNRSFGLIKDTYAFGEAGGNSASYVGGLVGTNERDGRVETSYSKGYSWGINSVGGLVGTNVIGGIVRNSYYDKDNALKSDTGKGTPKTTAQMKNKNELTGFDFTNVWNMDNSLNNGYPYLRSTGPGANYYAISTCQQLQNIKNDYYGYYELQNDIDCSATSSWDSGKGFAPIGYTNTSNVRVAFKGILDGNDFTIRDLTITRPRDINVGLFAKNNGLLTNVAVENAVIHGGDGVGILVGENDNGIIKHVSTEGEIFCTNECGGVAGGLENHSFLFHVSSGTTVTGKDDVGGLVGFSEESEILSSYATGAVSGAYHVGGLVGITHLNTTTEHAYATGAVSGWWHVGGLIGMQVDSFARNTYATGLVTGNQDVGGLVGWNERSFVQDSYATGKIEGTGLWTGGLVGDNHDNSFIENSYATGQVIGIEKTGGLVGSNHENAFIQDSYATGEVRGIKDTGGLAGSNEANAIIQTSYATGNVVGTGERTGGFVGDNYNHSLIKNSYAIGNVHGNVNVGGMIGKLEEAYVENVYANGFVQGTTEKGGLIGQKKGVNDITNSYYDRETTEQADTSKGTPLSTNQMKTQSSFVSWDFTSVWGVQPGINNSYPYLQILDTFVPKPDVIKDPTAQATSNTVTLSWENPKGSNIDKVRIFRNDVLIHEGKVNEFTDTGLTPSTTYRYDVYVVNGNGELSRKTIISITTDGLLTIDTSLEEVDFGTILLDGNVQTKFANPGNFTIEDTRNRPTGYHVTVSATPFTNQAINKTMNGTSLYLKKPTRVETLNGNVPPTIQTENEWLLNASGTKIISSAANAGSGEYRVQFAHDALKVVVDSNVLSVDPSHQEGAEYKATITWTIVSGP